MRSFIRSYVSATLLNTPATRCVFSASVTVWKPKCVSRSALLLAPSVAPSSSRAVEEGEEEDVVEVVVVVVVVVPARAAHVVEKKLRASCRTGDVTMAVGARHRPRAEARRRCRGAAIVR